MTAEQAQILAFERRWYRTQASKEEAIVAETGMSVVRYYQRLAVMLDDPEVLQAEPTLVNRLRRLRDSRTMIRSRR